MAGSASFVCAASIAPLPSLPNTKSSLQILARAQAGQPWTVAGERGALFGRQNGKFEAWLWPVKLLSNFSIHAELSDYPVPIDVNALSAEIRVSPAETVITYSHAAFTIRQRMFASRGADTGNLAASVIFEVDSVRPLNLTFSFTPEMLRMWPAPNHGRSSGEWVAQADSGVYVLHTDDPAFSGIVAMPRTKPGILVPYQERPQTYALELKLTFDPKRDAGLSFPLVFAMSNGPDPAAEVEAILGKTAEAYRATQTYYQGFFANRLYVETPDRKLDEALQWAEIALDQMQVRRGDETGMVAGYYESADSARPGYAWFFGRDTLWSTYATDSYGDFALTRRAVEFLLAHQREDGKMMHEYSQTAEALDWKSTPYFYASADSTQLLIMALADYLKVSGDVLWVRKQWPAILKAYRFVRAHEDANGIYSNAEGTGWVESWPGGMPHQEIYLAALDKQTADAMSTLASAMNDQELSAAARKKAESIEQTVQQQFYSAPDQLYAFSRNKDSSLDRTATIYPAVAWWDGTFRLSKADGMFARWASAEFSSDWGTRDISNRTPFYDPISYHQGSIWPLFTGWVSLAEYRAGRSLSGYSHLMQNAGLTWTQDLGSVTELLSGDLFQALGRSSSHQMWSSAMVISPLLRGLLGLDWDALGRTLVVRPQMPATWDHVKVHNVPLGSLRLDLAITRRAGEFVIQVSSVKPEQFCISSDVHGRPCSAAVARVHELRTPIRPVEIYVPAELPEPGSRTHQLKVIEERYAEQSAEFGFSGPGGERYELPVRLNRAGITVQGAEISGEKLLLDIPAGAGYQTQTVTFRWGS
ncbi:MAG: amylo-alpha-1,6-glucosidase [Bryobacteraceae bacterium]